MLDDKLAGDIIGLVSVVGVFFMPVIALWIIMHYRAQRHRAEHLSGDERGSIETLTRTAERMESRIGALEKILDAEAPHWRQTYKDNVR